MAEEEAEGALVRSRSQEALDPVSTSHPLPSLSRNVSLSKLNAQAPEFVPMRTPSPSPSSQMPVVSPSPPPPSPSPPPGMIHMFPPAPFHVPIHMVPVQNPHHRPHHSPHQQFVPLRNHTHNSNHNHNMGHHPHQPYMSVVSAHNQPRRFPAEDDPEVILEKSDLIFPEEALNKLLNQVEYYFSDVNLATTDHLMRFISKDSEGFVPLSVVASFRKVKAASVTNSQLAAILRKSSKLVVSEDGKRVKRLHPLTESDVEELQCRIVVAENLPDDHCHQNLMKIFSAVGSVKTIRTCPPQTCATSDWTSRAAKPDGLHFSNKLHAFVEYETVEMAEKAVVELNVEGNWRSGLRVRLMLKRNAKGGRGKRGYDEEEVSTSEQQLNDTAEVSESQAVDQPEEHGNEKENLQRKGRGKGRGKMRGRGQYHHNNMGTSVVGTQLVHDQMVMTKQLPPGPRMPDGTRGFAMGRGKATCS